jgi:hypothetical protein
MRGWEIARDAVMVPTPARLATSASVTRPRERLFDDGERAVFIVVWPGLLIFCLSGIGGDNMGFM